MTHHGRRRFLGQAGLASLAAALPAAAAGAVQADKVVLGVVGTGGMGSNHVRNLAKRKDVEIAWVSDVDSRRLAAAVREVEKASGREPKSTGDLRDVLDDKSVEAVVIATPDHWHAPAAILTLDAGKHVYVEKPCCHNVREGRMMVEAVERSGKVLQVGTQSRSTSTVREGLKHVWNGEIGDVLVAKAWNSQRRGSIGKSQPTNPPRHLDFDTWLGPAPEFAYRPNLLHSVWRWWHDFGCGDIGNDGVHDIDVALWGLGVETHPERVTCFGRKLFFDDDQQFPDTQYAVCDYGPDSTGRRRQLIFEQRDWSPYVQEGYENGAAFYGTKGLLVMGHSKGWRLYGERNKPIAEQTGGADLVAHHTNFLDAVRGGAKVNAPIEVGHRAATIVHLSNIAARTGRVLNFDPTTETITDDPESSALLGRTYREHWGRPRAT